MREHRCMPFTPGNDEKKITKLSSIAVDAIVLDLEDSVSVEEKTKVKENNHHLKFQQ
ncbi:MAG TPA: aldolase/citrate lyase family protein [Geobacterales bacterium]|nr:aldolase/citrate lyase family protein [Geobacterales bacterium]